MKYAIIKGDKSFSLAELLFSIALLIVIFVGILYSFLTFLELNDYSKNATLVHHAVQAQLERIREEPFESLTALDGTTFAIAGFPAGDAMGVIDMYSAVYSDMRYVRVVGCWRQKSGRVIGEDSNLDGILQPMEDSDGNTVMDSPVEIATLITKVQ